ncbi:MAG TPA: flagellar motor switch protein FliM [Phycisphaerales bacterium]|nr:flagellar motor switch protein FliM [Phycisphaerales bacterium]
MTDVLDQSEVDALLAAVDSGEVHESGHDIRIFSRHRKDFEGIEVRPYDFKRPERVSKDQMRAMETLHESFARNFGAALSGFLRTIVEVKVAACDQMTYSEFISSLPNPTSFNLLSAAPLEGNLCLEISPLIIYPIIDRLLGGTNQELFIPQRPLTMIETRLISKVTAKALEALKEAWSSIKALDFAIAGTESNPHLVQIVPPNEVVVVIGFELKMSSRAGTMNLCIPYNVIEPVMDDLSSRSWFSASKSKNTEGMGDLIAAELAGASLGVTGTLAETTITLENLMNLAIGDIITTDKAATLPVVLCVEGEKKMLAELGKHRGSLALKVVRTIERKDRA